MKDHLIVGAAIGDCVHVAGVVNFLNLAESWATRRFASAPPFPWMRCSTRWRPSIRPWWPSAIV